MWWGVIFCYWFKMETTIWCLCNEWVKYDLLVRSTSIEYGLITHTSLHGRNILYDDRIYLYQLTWLHYYSWENGGFTNGSWERHGEWDYVDKYAIWFIWGTVCDVKCVLIPWYYYDTLLRAKMEMLAA